MGKTRILLALGVWTAILPYLGFPYFFKNILFALTGLEIIYLSYLCQKELKKGNKEEKVAFDNFKENSDFKENEVKAENTNPDNR